MLVKKTVLEGYLREEKALCTDYIPAGQIGWVAKLCAGLGHCVWIYPRSSQEMLEELKEWSRLGLT